MEYSTMKYDLKFLTTIALFVAISLFASLAVSQTSTNTQTALGAFANDAYLYLKDSSTPYKRVADLTAPTGFHRVSAITDWQNWIRHTPLQPNNAQVVDYMGDPINPPATVSAVVAVNVMGKACQCADMAILLRSYFKFFKQESSEIRFKSVSGQWMEWKAWLSGTRYRLSGNGQKLIPYRTPNSRSNTLQAFNNYLRFVFIYAGSASLGRDLKKVASHKVMPGDLYIQPNPSGGIGHVSIVFDVATNKNGNRLYLMGYGYIPAMSLFIVQPESTQGIGNWFTEEGFKNHINPFGPGKWYKW